MKKSIIFLVFCCLLCKTGSPRPAGNTENLPQDRPAIRQITIDFSSKKNPTLDVKGIKKGDYYRVTVKNINLNLYKVSLTNSDTVLSRPLATPVFGSFDLAGMFKALSGFSELSKSMSAQKAITSEKAGESDKSIDNRTGQEINYLGGMAISVEKYINRIDRLKSEVCTVKLNALKIKNPLLKSSFTEVILSKIDMLRKDISTSITETIQLKKDYEFFSLQHAATISKTQFQLDNDTVIKKSYDTLLKSLSDILNSVSAEKTYEFLFPVVSIENNSGNSYTSLPVQFTGEQAKVSLTISPRDEKFNLQSYHTMIIFPQNSAQLAMVGVSLYVSGLFDETYSIVQIRQDQTPLYLINREMNGSRAEMGIATLLQIGKILNDEYGIGGHFCLGSGISLGSGAKPRVLIGAGFSLGEKHKVILDAGGIIGYVNRLSSTYYRTRVWEYKPENLTVPRLKTSLFFSVGYAYQF